MSAGPLTPKTGARIPLPPPLFNARCLACWVSAGLIVLMVLSFWSLDLQWAVLFSGEAAHSMLRFLAEFVPPQTDPAFVKKVAAASAETLAMSALGTAMAALAGVGLGLAAAGAPGRVRWIQVLTRWLLNALRSVPELVWASLLLIAAGLGPFAGTLALAIHTSGVLGRLFAAAIENCPRGPADALQVQGVDGLRVFLYATWPQVLPQIISYTLYRWENNIRAAAVLGVVGAGGLGQMLSYHMGLFQMHKTATVLIAMLLLVFAVDWMSDRVRRFLG